MTKKCLKTIREASFRCGTSKQEGLKPDLVVALKENAENLNDTVVSDSNEEGMMAAYRKREKYHREDLMNEVMTSLTGKTEASVIPIVVSFKGFILKKSAELMRSELKLRMSNLELLVVKTLNLINEILRQVERFTTRLHEAR